MFSAYSDYKGPAQPRENQLTDQQPEDIVNSKIDENNLIFAFSQMFKRDVADRRTTKLLWVIYNLQDNFQSNGDNFSRSLKSCVIKTQDKNTYILELRATR